MLWHTNALTRAVFVHSLSLPCPWLALACVHTRLITYVYLGLCAPAATTGFLGSGKTTLINHLLKQPHGRKLAVLENEVGEVAVDDLLLESRERTDGPEVILMPSGCVCCKVRGDLVEALQRMIKHPGVWVGRGHLHQRVVLLFRPCMYVCFEVCGAPTPGWDPTLGHFFFKVLLHSCWDIRLCH